MAPYRAILRYYRCDTPYRVIIFKGGWHSPKMVRYPPPWYLSLTKAYLCDTTFCNISCDDGANPPKKTSTKEFCDTIATSIARYEKYRCWASKHPLISLKTVTSLNKDRASLKGGVQKGGDFGTRVRGTMSTRRVQRDTVPARKCDYPPLVCGVSKCSQHLRDGTVAVRRGQSVIVPSSLKARDCR